MPDIEPQIREDTTMRFAVHHNAVTSATMSAHGELAATIEAKPQAAFEGNAAETLGYLKALPVGTSVEVRRYTDGGEFRGSRSCMNKPSMWEDLERDYGNA